MEPLCLPFAASLSVSPLDLHWNPCMEMTTWHTWAKSDVCILGEQPSSVFLVTSMPACSIHLRPESWRTGKHWGWDCRHLDKYMDLLKFLSLVYSQRILGTPRWEKMKPDSHQKLLCIDGFNFLHLWRKRENRLGFWRLRSFIVDIWVWVEIFTTKFFPIFVCIWSTSICLFSYSTNISEAPTMYMHCSRPKG